MKRTDKIMGLWFLTLFMVLGILALSILIYQDFSSGFYDEWSRALASSLENFENTMAGK